jgi:hypothetical protein
MQRSRKQTQRPQLGRPGATKGKTVDINYLRDHERGLQPGIKNHPKRMAMQAAPDHGNHE